MKKIKQLLVTLFFSLGLTFPSWAQSYQNETSIVQGLWGRENKEIIRENMQFTEAEVSRFWPVYESYLGARQKLVAERITILDEYVENYTPLNDEKAKDLTQRTLDNDIQLAKLQKKYYKKFKKVVSPLKASQFMQLENYLQRGPQ